MLKHISSDAFSGCKGLRIIYVENGCGVDLSGLEVPDSAKIRLVPEAMTGNVSV